MTDFEPQQEQEKDGTEEWAAAADMAAAGADLAAASIQPVAFGQLGQGEESGDK
jgi:hypothetical protein